ncbi:putative periplasmic beta-glucosidase [Actinacidiphila reveromycinica]|uniref:Exo-alpha-(1->6)-L-arabinopyranosidase n=2 Tax=Actinacidiphila reveromycinica TaxID=659352 RepID=A0A7U3UNJ4_9ACTN|nr:putative periplasmic beta-glucosidase [Streptomyces sp. SN-593]
MTPEEKFGQLQQLAWNGDTGPGGGQNHLAEAAAREGRLGSVLNLRGAAHTNALQRLAVEESRLGIPLLFGFDVIHGFWTTFPVPLAQAASFDPGVAVADARTSAREARSNGLHWTFAPMMDVTREPRWGRIAESCGEDPYLTARFAAAKVHGYQGTASGEGYDGARGDLGDVVRARADHDGNAGADHGGNAGADGASTAGPRADLYGPDRIAACAKHFVGYGAVEGGRDYNTVDVSPRRLRNLYLPPFAAAVRAGAATAMAAFNTVNGVPAHANRPLLQGVLKDEWGFDGVVVSDWGGVHELIVHGFAADGADAARLALAAGLDMEMAGTHVGDNGPALLAAGRIDPTRLDDAVRRVLRLKARLGLFDDPYTDEAAQVSAPTAASRTAAREAAARCAVLLKNDGALLPLDRSGGSLAVVGPYAGSADLHGTWSGPGESRFPAVSVLEAVRAAAPDLRIRHAADGAAAVEAVRDADMALVVVGEASALSGEASSRSDITLPAGQEELIAEVAATGRPFAVVVVAGRPLVTESWIERAPAVLLAWHGGIEAGPALADVLFGDVNPGGKLPVTLPRSVGQIPLYYNHENTGRPADPADPAKPYVTGYLDQPYGPRFPFGHGLSYTSFEVGAPTSAAETVAVADLAAGARVEVAVTVANTGAREGDEVVQLYLHDPVASVVRPVRELRGFRRVTLAAGERAEVVFSLGAAEFGFLADDTGALVLEPGRIDVHVGSSSQRTACLALTLV